MKSEKKLNKKFYIALGMVLLVPLFAACGNNEPNTEPNPNENPPVQEPADKEPTRFLGSEAVYNGIGLGTTMEELKEKLGEPQRIEEDKIDDASAFTKYLYADATYYFYYDVASSAQRTVSYIEITTSTAKEGPRGLKVGDTLDEVLAKYPQEKDWKTDSNGSFYGEDTYGGDAGAVYKGEDDAPNLVILTPKEVVPFMRIDIQDHIVTSYTLCYDLY